MPSEVRGSSGVSFPEPPKETEKSKKETNPKTKLASEKLPKVEDVKPSVLSPKVVSPKKDSDIGHARKRISDPEADIGEETIDTTKRRVLEDPDADMDKETIRTPRKILEDPDADIADETIHRTPEK